MRIIDMLLCIVLATGVSLLLMGYVGSHRVDNIKTIDLAKIMSAQNMLTLRASQSGNAANKAAWLKTATDAGVHLKAVIREIAGPTATVLVAQAVIDPKDDITKQVLLKLGLPANVPDLIPPKNAVTGEEITLTPHHKAGLPSFLTP